MDIFISGCIAIHHEDKLEDSEETHTYSYNSKISTLRCYCGNSHQNGMRSSWIL